MPKKARKLETIVLICVIVLGAILLKRGSENTIQNDTKNLQVNTLDGFQYAAVTNPIGTYPSSCKCHKTQVARKDFYRDQLNSRITWLNMTTLEHLSRHHPNFPASLVPLMLDGKCNLMKAVQRLYWSNLYWQEISLEDTSFLLYSAFIDNRPLTEDRPCVRILAHSTNKSPKIPFCYLWFDSTGPPVVTEMKIEYMYWENETGNVQLPFLMTCRIPPERAQTKPLGVSVVPKPCQDAYTLLEVVGEMERNPLSAYRDGKYPIREQSAKYNVAVCGSLLPYFMEDSSIHLVEWLEILRALGISKVFLHTTDVHPNVESVLQLYERDGFVRYTKYENPKPYPSEPIFRRIWSQTEKKKDFTLSVLLASDCILRHMHEYRYIAYVDPHEIPILTQHDSFVSWMDYIIEKGPNSNGTFPASYVLPKRQLASDLPPSNDASDLPDYLWLLRQPKVLQGVLEEDLISAKGLFDTDTATLITSYDVSFCGSGTCPYRNYVVNESDIYIGHFASECGNQCRIKDNTTEITSLLHYKDQVKETVASVLEKLELI